MDGKLTPNKDADAVRLIYDMFLNGSTIEEIRKALADKGVLTSKDTLISRNNIYYILSNETYKGDKLLQKKPPRDFITKKPNPQAQYESNYLTDDHEAIVDKSVWEAVQEKLAKNREIEEAVGHRGGLPHFLYGKVFCGECGEPMKRWTYTCRNGDKYKVWACRERLKGKKGNGCKMRITREDKLIEEIREMLGWDVFDEERFSREVVRVDVYEDRLEYEKQKMAG